MKVSNFTTSLADGRALLAILNDCNPSESPYDPTDNPADNLRRYEKQEMRPLVFAVQLFVRWHLYSVGVQGGWRRCVRCLYYNRSCVSGSK